MTKAKIYGAVDNGVTGSIGFIIPGEPALMFPTPVKKVLKYTKAKAYISRIDYPALRKLFTTHIKGPTQCFLLLERPLVNPRRFAASLSAVRALEATEILLEELEIPYRFIDSKEWQRHQLPKGLEGSPELKLASRQVGTRVFPHLKTAITKQKDADSILMAEYARLKQL